MRQAGMWIAKVVAILVLSAPASLVLTFLLLPVWNVVEARLGIESVGHSGPAGWCFVVVYTLLVMGGSVFVVATRKRAV